MPASTSVLRTSARSLRSGAGWLRSRLCALVAAQRANCSSGRMALAFLSVLTLAVAFGISRLPAPIVETIMLEETTRRAELWKRRILVLLEEETAWPETGALSSEAAARLASLPLMSDIYRLKIFDPEGRIVWSSRPGEIGTTTDARYFFDIVANGRKYALLDRKPASEIDNLELHSDQGTPEHVVAEIYVPFWTRGRFAGAVEFYSDVTATYNSLLRMVTLLLASIGGSGLLLAALGTMALIRANRRRMAEMNARAARDSESMARQVQLAREVQLLSELNEWLQSAATLDELFSMVSRFMTHLFAASEGAIYVFSNSRDVLDGWVAWNGAELRDHIRPDECWGLRRGRTYLYGNAEVNFACAHTEPHDGRPYFCFPILAHGETVGLMHLRAAAHESAADFRACRRLAQMAAEQISMAIANVQMRDQLREQSIRDPLTGLFNRRHMTETLRRQLQRARHDGAMLSLLSIDVDHFKLFNDNHGHDAGDAVLRHVAELLEHHVNGDEIACRPGGEEFAVILPGIAPDEARRRAEKLRDAVQGLHVHYAGKDLPRVTISVGVAHYPEHGQTVQDLVKAADEALYDAKACGRNTVCQPGESKTRRDAAGGHGHRQGADPAVSIAPAAPVPNSTPSGKGAADRPSGHGAGAAQAGKAASGQDRATTGGGSSAPSARRSNGRAP